MNKNYSILILSSAFFYSYNYIIFLLVQSSSYEPGGRDPRVKPQETVRAATKTGLPRFSSSQIGPHVASINFIKIKNLIFQEYTASAVSVPSELVFGILYIYLSLQISEWQFVLWCSFSDESNESQWISLLEFFSCPEKGSGDFHALYMLKLKLKVDLNLFFMSTVKQQDFKTSCPVPACMHAKSLKSYLTPHNTVAHQAPLFMGFSRQEYCSGLPRPPLGDLLGPGTEPPSPANLALHVDSLPLSHWGSPVQSLLAS